MSDGEDDYLSDKFLAASTASSSQPKTYSSIRKENARKAQLKNEQNKIKSRRQREVEARAEGLSKSLFERAEEEEAAGLGSNNKALSIMMKMGFKPGQSLGNTEAPASSSSAVPTEPITIDDTAVAEADPETAHTSSTDATQKGGHISVPLPLNEWTGKKGIGLGKRARSPSAAERTAKMAKMADETKQLDFRDRARHEYAERRADGRLGPAQRTCATLDEQAEKTFNVLWLNPNNPATFPPGLVDALTHHADLTVLSQHQGESIQKRLRRQMQADALQALDNDGDLPVTTPPEEQFTPEVLEEAKQFLRLQAQDRLDLVLSYLRERHSYCFWCGVKYENDEEMESQCPGVNEDAHD